MNQDKALLDLELRLLVARHGKARIANTLSTIMEDVDLAAIGDQIKAYEERTKKNKARHRPNKSIEEMVRKADPAPSIAGIVERLARAYDKKEFLPEFRDVKRFLESRRVPTTKFRSRSDAFPAVLRVLAGCFPLRPVDRLDFVS